MANLIKYAEALAKEPPTKVYKKLMGLFSKAQLALLGNPPRRPPDNPPNPNDWDYKRMVIAWDGYQQSVAQCQALANNWDLMVNGHGDKFALFKVTAICDFVAMCMMMIAAGSARIEELKAAIRGKKAPFFLETKSEDRAYLIEHGRKDFLRVMKPWCELENNGIVQFKFPANQDLHTFAIERAVDDDGKSKFIVYQGYQDVYSLSHFLGIQSVWDDPALATAHKAIWDSLSKGDRGCYQNQYGVFQEKFLSPQLKNVDAARKWVGNRQRFTYDDLLLRVLAPLAKMLEAEISHEGYVEITGSSSADKTIAAPWMIVFMCDKVSPEEFEANRKALYDCPADLTEYAECGMSS